MIELQDSLVEAIKLDSQGKELNCLVDNMYTCKHPPCGQTIREKESTPSICLTSSPAVQVVALQEINPTVVTSNIAVPSETPVISDNCGNTISQNSIQPLTSMQAESSDNANPGWVQKYKDSLGQVDIASVQKYKDSLGQVDIASVQIKTTEHSLQHEEPERLRFILKQDTVLERKPEPQMSSSNKSRVGRGPPIYLPPLPKSAPPPLPSV